MPQKLENNNFGNFLARATEINNQTQNFSPELLQLAEIITPEHPIVYCSMEIYDKDENDIKGGGGLGVLAADTRRQCQQLGIPQVVLTPFYTKESHQTLKNFWQNEYILDADPDRLYKRMGHVSVSTANDPNIQLDIYARELGSTKIITITEPNFGELYPGGNSDDHRLYQEVALGFGGYKALKQQGITPSFMQLNEAPTVFAAIAHLDDLCASGLSFDEAFIKSKERLLYTNHTLVPAVEGQFSQQQFVNSVLPNIKTEQTRDWVMGMFSGQDKLRLSALATELSGVKSGVSKLHAKVSKFYDRNGDRVRFEAVTNGISDKWIPDKILGYYYRLGVLDEFGLPTKDMQENLQNIDMNIVRTLKQQGRDEMNAVLAKRKDQYGNPVYIPDDAILYDFKRRFASYKRPDLLVSDTDWLADILNNNNAHLVLTGKPHPNDKPMKHELQRILWLVDIDPRLKGRVHYVQDYDEELGRALSVGGDCAINVPVVGEEACGTSWMKDIANFKTLISTPDGGVADIQPVQCLEVAGNEQRRLYEQMQNAADILGNDQAYRDEIIREVGSYMPVISGSRMMKEYLELFSKISFNGQ